jgi:putative ATP-binding cassette transporter
MFLITIGSGLLIAGTMAISRYINNTLKNKLYIDWRVWLYKKVSGHYFNDATNDLTLSRVYLMLDNPEQRIDEAIDSVVGGFLELSLGFIHHTSTLIIYIILLCLVGSSLSIMLASGLLVIPGFLVLIA